MKIPKRKIGVASTKSTPHFLLRAQYPILAGMFGIVFGLISSGCANVTYTRISTTEEEKASTGIPYFDTSTYILIQKDTNSVWQSSVLYLPDRTKRNAIDVCTFLAVNNSTFVFTNAVLSDSSVTTDSSAVPTAVVQAAAAAAAAGAKSFAGQLGGPRPASAYLFKIVRIQHQWGLVGASAPDLDTLSATEGL